VKLNLASGASAPRNHLPAGGTCLRDALDRLGIALRPLLSFAWRVLLLLTVSRALLVAWQWQRVSEAGTVEFLFLQGLRFDLVLLGLVLAVPVLAFPILASNRYLLPLWKGLLRVYLPAALLLIVFLECSTPSFIEQFDSRPNILFLEYLNHPVEIGLTLWAAYKVQLMLAAVALFFVARWINRALRRQTAFMMPIGLWPAALAAPVLLVLCVGFVRSTTAHRPVNPSTVAVSVDPMVNDLALSSLYTTLYALYEVRHEPEGGFRYAELDDATILQEVREAMDIDERDFVEGPLPTLHRQAATRERRQNLVIILEESLGAEFVGSLGGLDLTPNIDRLSKDGLWFEHLYATGTRSVRGLEAVVSGFTPTPARSVVKLGKSQRNFFTLAQLLGRQGYDTQFIYGGEAQFDNMRRFFMNNGFNNVVDRIDYENPVFMGSWGVSDEDLFNKAHEEFSKAHDKPFFSLVFTSSNHSPYQFPDNRIELVDEDKNTVNNAVKYADYALGEFIAKARESDYWDDTVFLIVADHNSRVYGADLVPVDRFHIPGLILGGSIAPAVETRVASQIDLGPTLLSLIGVSSTHPMIGHDLTRHSTSPGRAIMQYNGTQAYMEEDSVVVLRKDLPIEQFTYRDQQLLPDDHTDPDLQRRALAHANWTSMAYEQSLYRLPPDRPLIASIK
jgi:phosphoglycerol transferase MdoB-like AlkP superfamily enzyme